MPVKEQSTFITATWSLQDFKMRNCCVLLCMVCVVLCASAKDTFPCYANLMDNKVMNLNLNDSYLLSRSAHVRESQAAGRAKARNVGWGVRPGGVNK